MRPTPLLMMAMLCCGASVVAQKGKVETIWLLGCGPRKIFKGPADNGQSGG